MSGTAFLENEHVTLHPADEDDIPFLRSTRNDPRVRATQHAHLPADDDWARRRLGGTIGTNGDSFGFLVRAEGSRVGFVRLVREHPWTNLTRDGELGYWIAPEAWGNGYATAAGECMVEYAFTELGLHRVTASTFETNDASQRVIEKIGFVQEGVARKSAYVDGEWCDVLRFGLLEEEWQ